MPKGGWSSSTFEVQTASGSRWLIDMTSPKRSEAMQRAEALLALGKAEGVRVTELREGWKAEKVVFERTLSAREGVLKIDPVADLVMCKRVADYYGFDARLTIGRILRAYLDKNSLTALELMFNAAHLRALDRMDTYYPSAIQHVAALQAKMTGHSKTERLDKLSKVFDKVLKRARKSSSFDSYIDALTEHGPDRAFAEVEADCEAKDAEIACYGVLAGYMATTSGWREKLQALIDMAERASEPVSLTLVDEAIAEILDGKDAIEELFGGFSSPIHAWKTYMRIIGGRYEDAPRFVSKQIVRLSALFVECELPHTRTVLLQRISRGLKSTQALSKDGRDHDRAAFVGLVREMTEPAGLNGGPHMVEAVILRAKTLLSDEECDLPIDTAIRQALYLMPSQAVRLGVLLDLTSTDLGRKHDVLLRQQLMHLLDDLRTIYDLFPEDVHEDERRLGIDNLRLRLGMSVLSDEIKVSLNTSLEKLAEGGMLDVDAPSNFNTPEAKPPAKDGEIVLNKGEVLFHEGESGDVAYLVADGNLEVYRMVNGTKQHLATLGRGEIVGEMSLIDNQPRMASVCALENTQLMCISQKSLQNRLAKLEENDKVLHFLLKTTVRRLRGLARITE